MLSLISCFASVQIFLVENIPLLTTSPFVGTPLWQTLRPVFRHCAVVKQTGCAKFPGVGKPSYSEGIHILPASERKMDAQLL